MPSLAEQIESIPEHVSKRLDRFAFDRTRLIRLGELLRRGADDSGVVTGRLEPPSASDVAVLPEPGSAEYLRLEALGRAELEKGRLALVVLAGGMATRMGGVVKALVEALPGRTFLDLRLAEMDAVEQREGVAPPLWLMTSAATDEKIRAALGARLDGERVAAFPQELSLRLRPNGDLYLDQAGLPSEHAPGHGDLPDALKKSGLLERFVARGGRTLLATNLDNLGGSVDAAILGFHLDHGKPVTSEVVDKLGDDRGGIPVRVDGELRALEEFRLPKTFDPATVRVFNTNVFHIDARALLELDMTWRFYTVKKKIDATDVVQFERILNEITGELDTVYLRLPRAGERSRFLPVKDFDELERRRSEIEMVARARGFSLMLGGRLDSRLVFAALLSVGLAQAQTPVDRPTRLPSVGRGIVSVEDSSALVVNPANLATLPAGEIRWQPVFLDDRALVPWQGHAFSFSAPIPWIDAGLGLRLDLVDPPADGEGARFGARSNYQWLTGGLAFKAGEGNALGFSFQHAYSENPLIDGLSSWSIGYTTRPVNEFGMAFVANDINAPTNDVGGYLERSYDLGLALRPFGTRFLELGLEGRYVDAVSPYWTPRGTLGIDIPSLGRLRGDFSVSHAGSDIDRAWLASAQMAFAFNGLSGSMELAGGTMFGNGLGPDAEGSVGKNLAFDVAFRGSREFSASEATAYAVRIRMESTPNTREHVGLLRTLWRLATDEPSTAVVVLELRTAPAESLARVAELRDAIALLRQNGKKVLCHLEDADGASLYLCSAANRILLNPAGGIRFAGLRSRYFYFKSLLDKLGIRADFIRIGEHKSAPEMFTRDGATETSRADKIDLLQQIERNFVLSVAAGRHITPQLLRERIAQGPFIASEARAAGLVDGFAFDDQLEEEAGKLAGFELKLADHDDMSPRSPRDFGKSRKVAIVYVDGDMVDGRSQVIPFLGVKLVGSYTIAESLKEAREDERIGAVVLRIETGGGSAMAADVIWRQVQLTARVKPVVVSMGSAAASGGYYIASPATRIFANPLSITGSIGIFYGKADVSELLRKIGVTVEVYKTAPRADAESIFRPFTDEERRELERKVAQFYDMFLTRVADGRKLSKQAVDAVGQGRVWTGEQAAERKLVDELGGLRQALAYARRLAGMPEETPIVELPPSETTLLGRLLGIEGLKASAALPLPPQLYELARALAPFAIYPDDRPLALMELAPIGP